MLAITVAQVRAASLSRVNEANLNSVMVSLDLYARRGQAAYPCSVHAADLSIHLDDALTLSKGFQSSIAMFRVRSK